MNKKEKDFIKSIEQSMKVQGDFKRIENSINFKTNHSKKRTLRIKWVSMLMSFATCLMIVTIVVICFTPKSKNDSSTNNANLDETLSSQTNESVETNLSEPASHHYLSKAEEPIEQDKSAGQTTFAPAESTITSSPSMNINFNNVLYALVECEGFDNDIIADMDMDLNEKVLLDNGTYIMIFNVEDQLYAYDDDNDLYYELKII